MTSSSSMTRIVPVLVVDMTVSLPPGRADRRPRGPASPSARFGERQNHRKPRPLAARAVAANRPLVLAHDAVGDRQSEARAAAGGLRGEKRIVDARELLRWDAGPGVGNLGDCPIPIEARDDRQPSAPRHGIPRVEEQVEEYLLELM